MCEQLLLLCTSSSSTTSGRSKIVFLFWLWRPVIVVCLTCLLNIFSLQFSHIFFTNWKKNYLNINYYNKKDLGTTSHFKVYCNAMLIIMMIRYNRCRDLILTCDEMTALTILIMIILITRRSYVVKLKIHDGKKMWYFFQIWHKKKKDRQHSEECSCCHHHHLVRVYIFLYFLENKMSTRTTVTQQRCNNNNQF